MFNRCLQGLVVCVLGVMMLGASDAAGRFNRVGHEMMCVCSCGQVLVECNHVGCPDSNRMIGELRGQIAAGDSDTAILNWFASKYGAIVLAAPIRGGFDNVAWIAPIVVFLLATIGTAVLIRVWKLRSLQQPAVRSAGGPSIEGDEVRERIRRETQY
jgi:cytochrome c-type biogenesis protein CcmH